MKTTLHIKIFSLLFTLSISVGQILLAQNTTEMYNENLIPFQNTQHKWGYLEAKTGEIKIAPKYDQVSLFINGIAEVANTNPKAKSQYNDEGLIGWIDALGNEIFAPQFIDASPVNKFLNEGLIPSLTQVTTIDNKEGIVSWPEGNWVLKPGNYKDFYFYDRNYFIINKHIAFYHGKKYEAPKGYNILSSDEKNRIFYLQDKDELFKGLSTWDGNVLVAPKYLDVLYQPEAKRIVATKLNGILKSNNALKFLEQMVNENKNDLTIYLMNEQGIVLANFLSKYQPDIENDTVASYQTFDRITHYFSLKDGEMLPAPKAKSKYDYSIFKEGDYWGLKDENEKKILSAEFLELKEFSSNKVIALNPLNDKYGIIDIHGDQIVPFIYGSLDCQSDNRLLAEKNNKYGMINGEGNVIIKFKYLLSFGFDKNGRATVYENNKQGVIDENGIEIIPTIYQTLYNSKEIEKTKETYYAAQKDNKWGLLDSLGKVLVPFNYGNVSIRENEFEEGWVLIEDSSRQHHGLYNIKTDVLIPTVYDITEAYPNFIIVAKRVENDYYYQLLSTAGKPLTDSIYTKMDFTHGYLLCKINKSYGVLNAKGHTIVPFKYRYLWDRTPHLLMAQEGDNYFFINTKGNEFKAP